MIGIDDQMMGRKVFFGTELLSIDEIGFGIWYVDRQESWWSP